MIAFHIDFNYVDFAELYLMSIAKNAPGEKIYLSSMNVSAPHIERLKSLNDNLVIDNKWILDTNGVRWRQYMQCRITKVLLDVYELAEDGEICIVTDADMLLRKPLGEIYELMKNVDMMLKFDDEHLTAGEIQNGVIVFRKTPEVYDFLYYYNKLWDGKVEYRDDQRQLHKAWQKFRYKIRIDDLPHDYVDGDFQDSHIWSAHKGNRFNNYNKFRKEMGLPELEKCPNPSWVGIGDGS